LVGLLSVQIVLQLNDHAVSFYENSVSGRRERTPLWIILIPVKTAQNWLGFRDNLHRDCRRSLDQPNNPKESMDYES
jgi:hypothetical protein